MYVVTEPWYFANHRLDHAVALIDAGFEVHVATRRGDRWDEIVDAGCHVHELDLGRGAGGLASLWREVRATRRLAAAVRPDVVHAVALKPVAVALTLLLALRRPALILSVNGLGLSAATGGWGMRAIRLVLRAASRLPRVTLLFQTRSDQRAVLGDGERGAVIPGVGVDLARFAPGSRAAIPPVTVVYLGRAVASKGLLDLAEACGRGAIAGVELHLYCSIDDTSPGALSRDELDRLAATPGVTVHAPTREPARVLATAHAAILPSRAGEGVSKFVLEALASGAPVLLSAASGSGEVIDDATGVVFDGGDPEAIRAALVEVADWAPDRWESARRACRELAEREYSLDVILPRIVELHRSVAGSAP